MTACSSQEENCHNPSLLEGLKEFHIQEILDSQRHGRGIQYLVRWVGYGPEHDRWLAGSTLEDCEALDVW